jgi:hypothetical protein
MTQQLIDLTGKTFGRLFVEKRSMQKMRPPTWECKCVCGNNIVAFGQALRIGHTTSCGCRKRDVLRQKATIHGKSDTEEHRIWLGILARCNDKRYLAYKWYGALGVRLCDRWQFGENGKHGFECFLADIGPRPTQKHSIDRIDPFGNYEPSNCYWATKLQQANNRRNTRRVIYRGKEMALCDAVRAAGSVVHHETAWNRIHRSGWTVSDAIETPRLHISGNSKERRRRRYLARGVA